MTPNRQAYFQLSLFYFSITIFGTFSRTALPTYLIKAGLTLNQMFVGAMLPYLLMMITIPLLTRLIPHRAFALALITFLVSVSLLVFFPYPASFFIASLLTGCIYIFFNLPHNILHFTLTPKTRTGISSAIIFFIPALVSVLIPILSGYTAQLSIKLVWLFAIILCGISVSLVRLTPNPVLSLNFRHSLTAITSIRPYILLEAVWEAVVFGVIPLYTLHFLTTPLQYGLYLSYLALVGASAGLFLGKLTDKNRRRTPWLYPITLSLSLLTFLLALALENQTWWLVITGFIHLLLPLFWKFTIAFAVDHVPQPLALFPAREVQLAIGRFLGLALVAVCFSLDLLPLALAILALTLLFFPLILFARSRPK